MKAESNDVTFTLSVGGVEFTLSPDGADPGKVQLLKDQHDVLLTLTSFSGTLRVVPSLAVDSPKATLGADQTDVSVADEAILSKKAVEVTPKVSNPPTELKSAQAEASSSSPLKRTRSTAAEDGGADDEAEQEPDISQPTLLGQPDLSLTQSPLSTSQPADMEVDGVGYEEGPSKIQKLIDGASPSQSTSDTEDEPAVETQNLFSGIEHEDSMESSIANRVSIGASPVEPKGQSPPCPRWGHTMTSIGEDRILVYGGQTVDSESGDAKTLNDVFIFDSSSKKWIRPLNCDGMPRQWHSASFLPERNLLISFGGEAAHPKTGKIKTTEMVMVLDTEIMLWYPPSVSGDIPSGRSGHTATVLSKTKELVVFGGVKGSKWLNTVSVLDIVRWKWSVPKTTGSAPKPRSYHSATAIGDGDKIVIFGGNDSRNSFNSVHVLETSEEQWQWSNPQIKGCPPSPRTGHSAALLGDGKTICIYGGWDPNAEDDGSCMNDVNMFSKDFCFLLDTKSWGWRKGPKLLHADLPLKDHGPDGGEKRAGHQAVRLDGHDEILVLGGRVPGNRFVNDFQTLSATSIQAK